MKHLRSTVWAGAAVLALSASSALAADQVTQEVFASPDANFVMVGGIGYTWLKSNELVYEDDGRRLSQLIWETDAPVLTLGATARFKEVWTVKANAQVGFSGSTYMEDYDWLEPFAQAGAPDDQWSDRSRHSNTDLDRYINLDVAVGRDFAVNDTTLVNLHGGFKYTNVKRTSYGGDFVYSTNGFRDDIGNLPDGEKGITYEQRYPGLFVGGEASTRFGAWTLTGLVRGGVTINASDTDHHWMKNNRYEEEYSATPFVSVGAQLDYALSERASIFLGGSFEKFFRKTGNTTIHDISTGEASPTFVDAAGMDFQSATISAGLKYSF